MSMNLVSVEITPVHFSWSKNEMGYNLLLKENNNCFLLYGSLETLKRDALKLNSGGFVFCNVKALLEFILASSLHLFL